MKIDNNIIYSHLDKRLEEALILSSNFLQEIFSNENILKGDRCVIVNEPDSEGPMFFIEKGIQAIRLKIKDEDSSLFLISQLIHELVHYIFHNYKKEKTAIANRYEEIIAETITLFALYKYSYQNEEALKYYEKVFKYYERNKLKPKTIITKSTWIALEKNSNKARFTYYHEVLELFYLLKKEGIKPASLIEYSEYMHKNGSIDFQKWFDKTKNKDIKNISIIQPQITGM